MATLSPTLKRAAAKRHLQLRNRCITYCTFQEQTVKKRKRSQHAVSSLAAAEEERTPMFELQELLTEEEAIHILHFLHAKRGTSVLVTVELENMNVLGSKIVFTKLYRNEPRQSGPHGRENQYHAEKLLCSDKGDIIKSILTHQDSVDCKIKVTIFQNNSPCQLYSRDILQMKVDIISSLKRTVHIEIQLQYIMDRFHQKTRKGLKNLKQMAGIDLTPFDWLRFYQFFCTCISGKRGHLSTTESKTDRNSRNVKPMNREVVLDQLYNITRPWAVKLKCAQTDETRQFIQNIWRKILTNSILLLTVYFYQIFRL